MAFIDKPVMLVELKYDHAVETSIDQIKRKNYRDNLLLVSISYDKKTRITAVSLRNLEDRYRRVIDKQYN